MLDRLKDFLAEQHPTLGLLFEKAIDELKPKLNADGITSVTDILPAASRGLDPIEKKFELSLTDDYSLAIYIYTNKLEIHFPIPGGPMSIGDDSTFTYEFKGGTTDEDKLEMTLYPDTALSPEGQYISILFRKEVDFGLEDKYFVPPEAFTLELGVRASAGGGKADAFLELGAEGTGFKFPMDCPGIDGFIKKILKGNDLSLELDLVVGISYQQDFYFAGSGELSIELPIHKKIGPLEIDGADIAVRSGSEHLELGQTIKAELGPLKATVGGLGIKSLSDLTEFGFKPPSSVGLSLETGVFKGGGYLYIDPEGGEYAGALEFDFANMVVLKAVGIITTGGDDFSLLIIITAEFGGGIQLGFGFKLIGVGGLFGWNRTMKLEPLMQGVKTGAVDNILFPEDPVNNAQQIIKDLKGIFPQKNDIFLIGPMAMIGWGSPTLLSISLGIIIEIPGNLAILGVVKLALPDEDAALIKMQVNFAGAIDFDKGELYFFASLYDSRILFMTLEGDMGLMLSWGDNPTFLMSVGGFHPSYEPPASLPFDISKRLAITILDEDNARIRIEKYFALTSNTVQFGSRVEVFFGMDGFNVGGGLQFDALFQFDPFKFITSMSGSCEVEVFGFDAFSVSVDFTLEGPTPWHVTGTGAIEVLFFEADIDIEKKWGDEQAEALDTMDVRAAMKAELEKPDNWSTALPPGARRLAALRTFDPDDTEAARILHPLGNLRLIQKVAPLDLYLHRVGNKRPAKFALEPEMEAAFAKLEEAGIELPSWYMTKVGISAENFSPSPIKERFAIAQYQDMKEAEKLDSPAFQRLPAGVELGPSDTGATADKVVKRDIMYEEVLIDSAVSAVAEKTEPKEIIGFTGKLLTHFLKGNAAARSSLSKRRRREMQPFADRITVAEESFLVVQQDNFSPETADGAKMVFQSKIEALDYMAQQPKGAALQIIPVGELEYVE